MTLRPCPECGGARLRPESRAVLVGGTAIHRFAALSARAALEWVSSLQLSEHDHRIARLVLREIAERLFLSPKTVGTHCENILRKLGVRTRAQAIALAFRESLVERTPAG